MARCQLAQVDFANHATAYNLLKGIAQNAHTIDTILLVGDFNAAVDSETTRELSQYLTHAYAGQSFNGVDNFFTNCATVLEKSLLGSGGSDHDALSVIFSIS